MVIRVDRAVVDEGVEVPADPAQREDDSEARPRIRSKPFQVAIDHAAAAAIELVRSTGAVGPAHEVATLDHDGREDLCVHSGNQRDAPAVPPRGKDARGAGIGFHDLPTPEDDEARLVTEHERGAEACAGTAQRHLRLRLAWIPRGGLATATHRRHQAQRAPPSRAHRPHRGPARDDCRCADFRAVPGVTLPGAARS